MAVKPYTIIQANRHPSYCVVVEWLLNAGDTGQPFDGVAFPDKTVQMSGTFGGAVTMQGSNDVVNASEWNGLTDPQGNSVSMTAAGLEAIMENPYWIRPSAAAGVSAVTVRLCCAQSRR